VITDKPQIINPFQGVQKLVTREDIFEFIDSLSSLCLDLLIKLGLVVIEVQSKNLVFAPRKTNCSFGSSEGNRINQNLTILNTSQ
jgi:hypothetical protein